MTKKIYDTECLCLQARRADRVLTQLYDSYIKQCGLRSTQYGMLRCIYSLRGPCISDISEALRMDQTTVSRNVNNLCKMGLLFTSTPGDDPRKTSVCLTDYGLIKLEECKVLWENVQNIVKEQLGAQDYAYLSMLLTKVAKLIN